ncbi:hypothetical protein Asal01_01802 [Fodinibius salicampi]
MPVSTLWITLIGNQCLLKNNGFPCDNCSTGCCKVFGRKLRGGGYLGHSTKPVVFAVLLATKSAIWKLKRRQRIILAKGNKKIETFLNYRRQTTSLLVAESLKKCHGNLNLSATHTLNIALINNLLPSELHLLLLQLFYP